MSFECRMCPGLARRRMFSLTLPLPCKYGKKNELYKRICLSVISRHKWAFQLQIKKTLLATGEAGPPLTCPLPEGAGYQVVLRNNSNPVFCSSKGLDCPADYECIQGLELGGYYEKDGVCCPTRGKEKIWNFLIYKQRLLVPIQSSIMMMEVFSDGDLTDRIACSFSGTRIGQAPPMSLKLENIVCLIA